MSEPTLRDMSDYDSLKGEKRRVVWAVILAGLIIGSLFVAAKFYFGDVSDTLAPSEKIGKVPYNN